MVPKSTLYQGKTPSMNSSAPAMTMIFSPTLRALDFSLSLFIQTSYESESVRPEGV